MASFEKATNSVMSRLDLKTENYYQLLRSMRGLYDNLVQVVREYFMLYGSVPVKTYPSIMSLMYVPKIDRNFLPEHIHFTQSQGLYSYKVFPEGSRDNYYPAAFIVPSEKNFHISGFDFGTNPITKSAIDLSCENDFPVSTPFFAFRPDTTEFMIMSPIYKKDSQHETASQRKITFEGVVLIEINVKKYFEEALGKGVPSDTSIVFEIFDVNSDGKDVAVYNSKNTFLIEKNYKPALASIEIMNIANRHLKVKFYSVPDFGGKFQEVLPVLSLIISLVLSFVFFGFILQTITSKSRAIDLADRMTLSQRRIVEASKDIIAVMDLDGKWMSMNHASIQVFGLTPEELIGKKIDSVFSSEEDSLSFHSIIKSTDGEKTERLDYKMKSKSGESKWIDWSLTISKHDGLVYAIGRDVSLEKKAGNEAHLRAKQIQLAEQFTREASESKSYFITKISHQIRNSLTSIMGYLQMLSNKIYDTDEERDSYVDIAEESSGVLYEFTSDILEMAQNSASNKDLSRVSLISILDEVKSNIGSHLPEGRHIVFEHNDELKTATVISDKKLLIGTFVQLVIAISEGNAESLLQFSATANTFEGVTEISIVTNPNRKVAEMIQIYLKNHSNIIDSLKDDYEDVLLNIAIAESNIRMLNGSMQVDTLGVEEGNVVQINLPLKEARSE